MGFFTRVLCGTVASYATYRVAAFYFKPDPADIVVTPDGPFRVGVDSAEGPPPVHFRKKRFEEPPMFAGPADHQLHRAFEPAKLTRRKRFVGWPETPFRHVA